MERHCSEHCAHKLALWVVTVGQLVAPCLQGYALTLVGGHPALATSGKCPASQHDSGGEGGGEPAGGRVRHSASGPPLTLPSPRPATHLTCHSAFRERKAASAAHDEWCW